MDIALFTKMLSDRHFTDYKRLKYKYPQDFQAFLQTLSALYYKKLPLLDFDGEPLVFIENHAAVSQSAVKLLLLPQSRSYGIKAAEDEIVATASIESIDFSRDSVRNILKGYAPADEQEDRILGVKRGLEFIADTANKITEENLCRLYKMTVDDFLPADERLKEGCFYRHDTVFVVSDRVEHAGLDCKKVPSYMKTLVDFINTEDGVNDLIKATIIHFYVAFVHPYFDGNGRMARLLHLWYLIQRGYRSALFIPFSSRIEKSRKAYYDAYTAVEENKNYSGVIDVTPFLLYVANNVYNKMCDGYAAPDVLNTYETALNSGKVTPKEAALWQFVLSYYGTGPFSTKQLEKDFGNAAYATIRAFVLKFESLGLLAAETYGSRVKYKISK